MILSLNLIAGFQHALGHGATVAAGLGSGLVLGQAGIGGRFFSNSQKESLNYEHSE